MEIGRDGQSVLLLLFRLKRILKILFTLKRIVIFCKLTSVTSNTYLRLRAQFDACESKV